ncbi:biogenesis of lysosome-related organelles complex 1 subunit 1-like [Phragmites australis]|uniref:biogenesis of lysosome-related organelles complex 1 subunit 1-like n=1 Tax=Phragmites australis TaxID=29695 RepID=UPI002D7A0450|nr:biogenesis of lysosome-related organelles complex 1 subunit 1-like [Phragmites australis]XP_062202700.1 biogenesis of lysosome-related organelles complex 1 subunit 1-like [Phragmites australis]XP_062202701.1 biogenesis of lysosome-related organelles complex 1 subunit 1-like [Phragmites australis]
MSCQPRRPRHRCRASGLARLSLFLCCPPWSRSVFFWFWLEWALGHCSYLGRGPQRGGERERETKGELLRRPAVRRRFGGKRERGRDGMDGAKRAPAAAGGKLDLEEALLQIVHEHRHQSLRQRQQTERAKKDALRSAVRVADLLVDTVDGGVQDLFVNEKRIELEARALLGTIGRYRKQTDQWLAATNAINSVLKEIGDFENWMKIMDFDCKSINAAIRNIHQS